MRVSACVLHRSCGPCCWRWHQCAGVFGGNKFNTTRPLSGRCGRRRCTPARRSARPPRGSTLSTSRRASGGCYSAAPGWRARPAAPQQSTVANYMRRGGRWAHCGSLSRSRLIQTCRVAQLVSTLHRSLCARFQYNQGACAGSARCPVCARQQRMHATPLRHPALGLIERIWSSARRAAQIIGPVYILRNFSRGASILSWALRNALRRTLLQPFHMINLLKFRAPGGQQTYDLYRDAAAGVVMREGGGLAYMGTAVVRPHQRIMCMCIWMGTQSVHTCRRVRMQTAGAPASARTVWRSGAVIRRSPAPPAVPSALACQSCAVEGSSCRRTQDRLRPLCERLQSAGDATVRPRAQAPEKAGFDEVMIVKYKSRFQFFHMALLDWHYWPLMCAASSLSVHISRAEASRRKR